MTRETKDGPVGVIVKDPDGEPTGILKDAAMELVDKVVPPYSTDEKLAACRAATEHAASLGVTTLFSSD